MDIFRVSEREEGLSAEEIRQALLQALQYGYNTLPDGEEIYYIPNPALGLWINREAFGE